MEEKSIHLSWNSHNTALVNFLPTFRVNNTFCDVTICCNGVYIQAHRLILSTFSDYFKQILELVPCRHPFIIIQDVLVEDFKNILDFIYSGEAAVANSRLNSFLKAAKNLKIKGLNMQILDNSTQKVNEETIVGIQCDDKNYDVKENFETYDEPLNNDIPTYDEQLNNDIPYNASSENKTFVEPLNNNIPYNSSSENKTFVEPLNKDIPHISSSENTFIPEDKIVEEKFSLQLMKPKPTTQLKVFGSPESVSKKFKLKKASVVLKRFSKSEIKRLQINCEEVEKLKYSQNHTEELDTTYGYGGEDSDGNDNQEVLENFLDPGDYSNDRYSDEGHPLLTNYCSTELYTPNSEPSTSYEGGENFSENFKENIEDDLDYEIKNSGEDLIRSLDENSVEGDPIKKTESDISFDFMLGDFAELEDQTDSKSGFGEIEDQIDYNSLFGVIDQTIRDSDFEGKQYSFDLKPSFEGIKNEIDCKSEFGLIDQNIRKSNFGRTENQKIRTSSKVKRLGRTLKKHHPKMGKRFSCPLCNYKGKHYQYLTVHLRTHTGEKPFHCPHCSYRSAQKSTLNTHLHTHEERKLLKCDFCPFEAKKTIDLEEHKYTHFGKDFYPSFLTDVEKKFDPKGPHCSGDIDVVDLDIVAGSLLL